MEACSPHLQGFYLFYCRTFHTNLAYIRLCSAMRKYLNPTLCTSHLGKRHDEKYYGHARVGLDVVLYSSMWKNIKIHAFKSVPKICTEGLQFPSFFHECEVNCKLRMICSTNVKDFWNFNFILKWLWSQGCQQQTSLNCYKSEEKFWSWRSWDSRHDFPHFHLLAFAFDPECGWWCVVTPTILTAQTSNN